jgi:hypothetical protein
MTLTFFPVPVLAEPESKLALHTPKLACEGEARESTNAISEALQPLDSRGGRNVRGNTRTTLYEKHCHLLKHPQ